MFDSRRYTTGELEIYIRSAYARLEPAARADGVFHPLDDFFGTGTPKNLDGSFCFSDGDGYHYCVAERGRLVVNEVTKSLFEITYLVLSSDIFWMAVDYERKHRAGGRDFRRLLFQKEMQYWHVLGDDFAEKAEQKIREALKKAPFAD